MELSELLVELGIPCKEHGEHHHCSSPSWIQMDCPHCSPGSGRFRLGISKQWLNATCWSCGPVYLIDALTSSCDLSKEEIRKRLPIRGSSRDSEDVSGGKAALPKRGRLIMPSGLMDLCQNHKAYLRSRGFDPDTLARLWGLKATCLFSNYPWRIIIPVVRNGETVSYTTRNLSDTGTRYVNAKPEHEVWPIRDQVFGLDFVRYTVLVTEGPFDAMRIGPGAVSVMGAAFTSSQASVLAKVVRRVVVFDSDATGQMRAKKLVEVLSPLPGETVNVQLESGKDPASASTDEIEELRKRFLED